MRRSAKRATARCWYRRNPSINTQETNLHNIAAFQRKGLLHLGWAGLGLVLGLGGFVLNTLLHSRQALHTHFTCQGSGTWASNSAEKQVMPHHRCQHQEIYELLIISALPTHASWCQKRGIKTCLTEPADDPATPNVWWCAIAFIWSLSCVLDHTWLHLDHDLPHGIKRST